VPAKRGNKKRPPQKRGDPLRIPLPFEEAIEAALETPPPDQGKVKKKARPERPA